MTGRLPHSGRGGPRPGSPSRSGRGARRAALSLLAVALVQPVGVRAQEAPGADATTAGWPTYGGDPGGMRYSPLAQITPENVASLEVAWTYHTGDVPGTSPGADKTAFQATPILRGDTLYFCSPLSRIFALDAETGEERWVYDARPKVAGDMTLTCRGVAYWQATQGAEGGAACAARVFMGTIDNALVAIDAQSGRPCADFGRDGRVDLGQGLGEIEPGESYMTSPPTIVGDVVVTGAMVRDNRRVEGPGGVVRGWDARTGQLRWAFDPVPPGVPAPPPVAGNPRFHRGTPNAWSIFSADLERGLVFVPFGNPSPDFAGAHRNDLDYYGSSTVALDAETGEPVWRFQSVHHDLWDYDVASQPTLLEVEKEGSTIPAVAQPTKMGHLFLLDRETGVPIFPVEERPVPQTDVPGEWTAPTQPFPTFPAPLHPHRLDPDEAFGFTPWDRGACRARIEALRNDGIFTPPSLEGSIQYPGVAGGANWGSLAHDPERRVVVLNQNLVAQVHRLIPRAAGARPEAADRHMGISEMAGTPFLIEQKVLLSPFGVPCIPTPWGVLMAVSLETGQKLWEVPFGTTRDMVPFFPIGLDFGLPSMGGPILTKSGLVFIGASMDAYLRAYSVETGERLWRARLPAGGQATPMTYRVRPGGRQFVVIAAGGHGTLDTIPGDAVVAFALPETN